MSVSIQDIYEVRGKPHALLIWDNSIAELNQMDREVDIVLIIYIVSIYCYFTIGICAIHSTSSLARKV